jgi:putative transposase
VHGGAADARDRWRGATRARTVRTTVADPAAARAADLVKRCFRAPAPGLLHVADVTYVPLAGGGFGYTAFVIDAYAGLIPGWECSTSKHTSFVESAIRQAVAYRRRQGRPPRQGAIHHSDAGSQPGFNRSLQHQLIVVRVAVGSVLRLVSSSRVSCVDGC